MKLYHTVTGEQQKVQFILDIAQRDVNTLLKQKTTLKKVSAAEKIKVFQAMRWSFMSHEELVELSTDPDFELARGMILEGLSSRLVNFEKSMK